jgi:hypothetical protein
MVSMTSWEMHCRQLQEDEDVIAQHRLDRRRAQVGDLLGFINGLLAALIGHPTKVAPTFEISTTGRL